MSDEKADRLEAKYSDVIIVDSVEKGLKYMFDGRKDRFAIAGKRGMVMLSMAQARALINELEDILELRGYITEREPVRFRT